MDQRTAGKPQQNDKEAADPIQSPDVDMVYVDRNGEDWLVRVENVVKQERQWCGRLWGICDGSNSRDGEDQWTGEDWESKK